MPVSKLMQKLSGRLDRRCSSIANSTGSPDCPAASSGDPMECSTSFEVVVEVLPLSAGSRGDSASACSASVASSEPEAAASRDQQQQPLYAHGRASSSSAALLASSVSGPLPVPTTTGSKLATVRALRARGKAMLRTQAGLPCLETTGSLDLQQQLSLDSNSSSMDAMPSAGLPANSPRFMRSSTTPLPGSLRSAGITPALPALLSCKSPTRNTAAATVAGAAAEQHDDDADCDELLHPISPAEAASADEDGEHCHWEDGIVASWLQDIDHAELLHSGDDHQDDEEDGHLHPAANPAAASPAALKQPAAVTDALQSLKPPASEAVFSSLLYK